MGDSGIILYLSLAAFLIVVSAIVAFTIAWRINNKAFRITIGSVLIDVALVCGILSLLTSLLIAALGVGSLVLAGRTPQRASSQMQGETEQ